MSQTEELERRITAAMDRISQSLEGLDSAPSGGDGDTDDLRQQLEDEKLANAQLEERVRTLKDKQDSQIETLKAEAQSRAAQLTQLDRDLQRLRKANDQLRSNVAALREANEAGVGEPHLINKAMLAELEALRASRAADVAEADAIMGELGPLLSAAAEQRSEDA